MRAFAIAVLAAVLLLTASQVGAADFGVGPRYYEDPKYAIESRDGYYADCGRRYRGIPYRGDTQDWGYDYGPNPNSAFFGPLGYHCYGGVYAYFPSLTTRCRSYLVSGPNGWVRVRRCN